MFFSSKSLSNGSISFQCQLPVNFHSRSSIQHSLIVYCQLTFMKLAGIFLTSRLDHVYKLEPLLGDIFCPQNSDLEVSIYSTLIYNWPSDFLFFVLKMYVKLIIPLFDQNRYWQQRSPDPSQKHHHHMSLGITSFCKKKNTKHSSIFITLWNMVKICTTHLKIYQMISWPTS